MAPLQTTTRDPPAETISHFESIGWTRALLSDPLYTVTTSTSRVSKAPRSNEDSFIAHTLSTDSTIPHLLTLRLRELPHPPPQPQFQSPPSLETTPKNPTYIQLVTASPTGLSGFPDVLHGGAVATLLDECLSCLVSLQTRSVRTGGPPILTAKLDVSYKRPVMLPGTYAVRAWVTGYENPGERDGKRKRMRIWIAGDVVDGQGRVHSEAKGLWVESRVAPRI